jgi:polyphenol oxidase
VPVVEWRVCMGHVPGRVCDRETMEGIAADGFHWTDESWGRALRSRPLAEFADHFFTSLPLRLQGDAGQEQREWARVAAAIGVPDGRLLRLKQVHGNVVVVARASGAEPGGFTWREPEADIIVSDDPTIALAVQVADCVPLLVADRASGAVGAAHAGWRGTAANVAGTTVAALSRQFGSRPEDLVVAHGPSIGACCYEVGEELVGEFERAGFGPVVGRWFERDARGRLRLDLWAANRDQLLAAGVAAASIHQSGLCTSSHPQWFASYRRDGAGTGRIAGVIRARS